MWKRLIILQKNETIIINSLIHIPSTVLHIKDLFVCSTLNEFFLRGNTKRRLHTQTTSKQFYLNFTYTKFIIYSINN